jgi:hypothetical protein
VVGVSTPGDPIDDYLDLLYARLRITPRQARRILAEAEDHLREAVDEGLAAGLTEPEAQEQAISSFGSVRAVVRAHDTRLRRLPAIAVVCDLAMSAWKLLSIGLLAVGASGLVAGVMNAVFGYRFVGGTARGTSFPAAACQGWLANNPAAHSCAQAAVMETSADAVSLRVAAGVIGLALLAGYHLSRRGGTPGALPEAFVPTVAVSLFGAGAAGLAWLAVTRAVVGPASGPGFYLSGVIVALAAAGAFVPQLRRTLLRHARG